MSNYSKFLDDLNDFYKDRKINGILEKISNDAALAAVRDKWIQQDKLKELISFIHTNWDSGNCDDFISPLEFLLVNTKQGDLFKQLWTKIIKFRLSALWTSVDSFKTGLNKNDLVKIASIDISDFNMFSKESYKDLRRVVAFRRQFAIDALTKYKSGLIQLQMTNEAKEIDKIIDGVKNLNKRSSTF